MKIKELIKANYKHIICIAITIIFAMCAFIFPYFFPRLIESCRDFGTSIAYWFCQLFEINHKISPSIINYSETPLTLPGFPNDYNSFTLKWQEYWQLFVTKANVASYFKAIAHVLITLSKFLVIILPLVIVSKLGFKRYLTNENNDYNKDSKPLIAFKKFERLVYLPVKNWLISLVA